MNPLRFGDIRFAIRRLRKDAGATSAAVVALACGIGAGVATWSLLSAVLLRPLPVEAPERLFEVDYNVTFSSLSPPGHSYPVFESIRGSGTFEGIAAGSSDPRVTLEGMTTLEGEIARQMSPQRFGVYVLGALGGIALMLTVLGTYVIAESMIVRRRRELGIRAALGAGRAQLRRLVLRDAARLVGIGLGAGFVLVVLGARLIRSLLYEVQPLDPWALATASAVIFGLALLVSLRPALEASRLDVTRSLREE